MDLAEELLKEYKNDISQLSFLPSSGGVFEIRADDFEIFSKKDLGRFPNPGEVDEILKNNK